MRVPGDKSISHRALLLASLAQGESRISGLLPGADCRSTASCLRALGVEIPELPAMGEEIRIRSAGAATFRSPSAPLDCGNSGTTARLLMGLLAGLPLTATLTGDASLRSRPMRRVTEPLSRMGAGFREEGDPDRLPVRLQGGRLKGMEYRSPVASAQVKSALLLAGLTAGVPVTVIEPHRSRDHTERMLRLLGVEVEEGMAGFQEGVAQQGSTQEGSAQEGAARGDRRSGEGSPEAGWRVHLRSPTAPFPPLRFQVPGDFSSAVFPMALALLGGAGGELRIQGVGLNPTRTGLLPVLSRMGAALDVELELADDGVGEPMGEIRARPGALAGVEVDGGEIALLIDEVPILAVLAARARGVTRIRGAGELRVKESDRISALARNLAGLGVEVEELEDGLVIHGTEKGLRGRVRTYHDHRIAMAFGVLAAAPGTEIQVEDPGVVEVSYPGFWESLEGSSQDSGSGGEVVVALDGPAAAGKSSTAREVARILGYRHLDSGALYRALTLALLRSGVPEEEWESVSLERLQAIPIALERADAGFRVLVDGREPGEELRSAEVTSRVARAARIPAVRQRLLELQRAAGEGGGIVADGRDMGTVVFPDAAVKVFLVADPRERARRRILQEGRDPTPEEVEEEVRLLRERDRSDQERASAPLRKAEDAVEVDTTRLSFEEQVEQIVSMVRAARAGSKGR